MEMVLISESKREYWDGMEVNLDVVDDVYGCIMRRGFKNPIVLEVGGN